MDKDRIQLRIQSDGTGPDTVVTTPDGRELHPKSLSIFIDKNELNRVDLEFFIPVIDAHATVNIVHFDCPVCSHRLRHSCSEDS